MGMYAVDVVFDCFTECGTHLNERIQTMDAFIGYGGKGDDPPSLIKIGMDRIAKDAFTGKVFDPIQYGCECNSEWFEDKVGRVWHVTISGGKVVIEADNSDW